MLDVIEKLLVLQDRDRKILQTKDELAHVEPERRDFQARTTGSQAKLDAAKLRVKHLESDRKKIELDVEAKQQQSDKYATQQLQTKKNEEYRALQNEIENCKKAIGVLEVTEGAFCASGSNRRRWGNHHHLLDPHSLTSPQKILATWVQADTAAMADALSTCIFLAAPENFLSIPFEYCILNSEYKIKKSAGFSAELFS